MTSPHRSWAEVIAEPFWRFSRFVLNVPDPEPTIPLVVHEKRMQELLDAAVEDIKKARSDGYRAGRLAPVLVVSKANMLPRIETFYDMHIHCHIEQAIFSDGHHYRHEISREAMEDLARHFPPRYR